jgi:sugar lactone lactonase YvrE
MVEIKKYKVTEPWLKTTCGLGEAPYWDKKTNTLRFFDIIKKQMHTVNLDQGPSSHKTIDLPFSIGTTADIEGNDDEFVFGGKSGFGIANKQTGDVRYIKRVWESEEAQADKEHRMRSNDGAVDSEGRFYVGTMNDPAVTPPGPEGNACILRTFWH